MYTIKNTLETDVLVVGGGIGGLMASIGAAERGSKVIVAEKANTRRSGSGASGNDHFLCYIPEKQQVDVMGIVREMLEGQVGPWHDTQLTKKFLGRTFEMVQKWDSWGINMRPFGDWVFMGHAFPERPRMYIKYDGHNQKQVLTAKAKSLGVKILNHHPVSDILVDGGEVVGGLVFSVKKSEPEFTLIRAKAVIIATGCSARLYTNAATPAMLFNQGFCPACAGGMAPAYRAGAKLVNMEHPYVHAGTKYFARCGKATWIGVYKYPDGRPLGPFVTKPDRELGDNTSDVWKSAFTDVMSAGTGPAYLDCSEASPEDLDFMYKGMRSEGLTSQLDYMAAEGIDPARHAVEFQQYEPIVFGRGLEIDLNGATNIQGLYVAGDVIGNFRSGIAGAVTWGWISAENAAERAANCALRPLGQGEDFAGERLALYSRFRERRQGPEWLEFNMALQQIMSDYCPPAPRVRSETLLQAGLKYLGDLRHKALESLNTPCSHTLMRGLEVLDLIDLGEAVMVAARERKETRLMHKRSDFTFTNPLLGDKFLNVYREDGSIKTAWRKRWMA